MCIFIINLEHLYVKYVAKTKAKIYVGDFTI